MKVANLVGERLRETPSGCQAESHALLVRGGYMKPVASGIFSALLPLRRVTSKIERIIREEMERIGGQEVQFPVVLPASLWEESGRYQSVGSELLRFQDRNGSPCVLGMTHEEAAVQLAREYGSSYAKYPFMIYQIQTKFRDEARPRCGLIRVREFTMKDGYSFHTSQEDLDAYYRRCHEAYERIFARVGLPEVVSVASDSGMMGGSVSHEFMLLSPIGEDSIAICPDCGYRANLEAAPNLTSGGRDPVSEPLTLIPTPGVHTIEELCAFLKVSARKTCKAVVYEKASDGGLVVVFLRGDLEVSEAKVRAIVGDELRPASLEQGSPLKAGFIGPCGLGCACSVLYDRSLRGENNLACGGNREGFHFTGLDVERDLGQAEFVDAAKAAEGGVCPACGRPGLTIQRGIEVGNIFQLGDKYSKAMHMAYTAPDGGSRHPLMGCYGIGIGRLAASICEARHDAYGPIWPMSVAPWQVHLCAVRVDTPEVRALADRLYEEFTEKGIEVLYDDRPVSPGVMFSDADLLGAPLRVIVSPRNLREGRCEIVTRDQTHSAKVEPEACAGELLKLIQSLL